MFLSNVPPVAPELVNLCVNLQSDKNPAKTITERGASRGRGGTSRAATGQLRVQRLPPSSGIPTYVAMSSVLTARTDGRSEGVRFLTAVRVNSALALAPVNRASAGSASAAGVARGEASKPRLGWGCGLGSDFEADADRARGAGRRGGGRSWRRRLPGGAGGGPDPLGHKTRPTNPPPSSFLGLLNHAAAPAPASPLPNSLLPHSSHDSHEQAGQHPAPHPDSINHSAGGRRKSRWSHETCALGEQ